MLCYALSSLGLIGVKIANCIPESEQSIRPKLFIVRFCIVLLNPARCSGHTIVCKYYIHIQQAIYEMTFPESTYYIHVYGLWMARPRDLQVACAFPQGFFCNVGANEKHANTCHASFFFLVQNTRKSQWSVQGLFPTSPRPRGKISHYMFGARWCSYML